MKKLMKDLRIGDVLASTGIEIISNPQRGLKTPIGKYEIGVKYPNGEKRVVVWSGNTPVQIKEKSN